MMNTKAATVLLLSAFALGGPAAGGGIGSIWSERGGATSMFADRKASTVGDIVTVVVDETTRVSTSRETQTDKNASLDSQIGKFFFSPENGGPAEEISRNGELPGLEWSSTGGFRGGGEIANSQSLSARAAVMVIDVLPNGNLLLEGVRVTSFSGETQYAVLRGLIRREDIRADNTVPSSDIADARVEFISEGALTDSQRKGWLTRLHDKLNPF